MRTRSFCGLHQKSISYFFARELKQIDVMALCSRDRPNVAYSIRVRTSLIEPTFNSFIGFLRKGPFFKASVCDGKVKKNSIKMHRFLKGKNWFLPRTFPHSLQKKRKLDFGKPQNYFRDTVTDLRKND